MSRNYVGYYRVSTEQQGRSGLGLESQQNAVREHANDNGVLIGEYEEVVSGNSTKHTVLDMALAQARREKACLLVKRLDRFSRRVSFISWLLEQGVDLEVVEMPNATTFQLHIYAALAEEERRMISQRTKAALKVAKERGVTLGINGKVLALQNHKNALEFAIETLAKVDTTNRSYSSIARELNDLGLTTYRGGRFYPQTIKNMIGYLGDLKFVDVPYENNRHNEGKGVLKGSHCDGEH
tara:strand:+ start:168 stop:884 length:717 start_codon:yes stop_codon:yes gene_type:complete